MRKRCVNEWVTWNLRQFLENITIAVVIVMRCEEENRVAFTLKILRRPKTSSENWDTRSAEQIHSHNYMECSRPSVRLKLWMKMRYNTTIEFRIYAIAMVGFFNEWKFLHLRNIFIFRKHIEDGNVLWMRWTENGVNWKCECDLFIKMWRLFLEVPHLTGSPDCGDDNIVVILYYMCYGMHQDWMKGRWCVTFLFNGNDFTVWGRLFEDEVIEDCWIISDR